MNYKDITPFLFILISPLFSQFEENLMTISFNGLSSQEKLDTLYFVKTQADKIIIRLFPEKSITVQEIVGIKDDSIRVELLQYWQFQWKKMRTINSAGNYYNTPPNNTAHPEYRINISIQDIQQIQYKDKPSTLVLLLPVIFIVMALKMLGL